MGCWNGSCAMTGLPVHHGDPVRVFLLVEREFHGSHCYNDAYWAPMHYHFKGEYNDYGAVEECTGEMIPFILDIIKRNLVEMEQGDNEYHDIPVKADEMDLELLFEADHEHRLKLKSPYRGFGGKTEFSVSHIIIHEYVFQQMLDRFQLDTWNNGEIKYADIVAEGMKYIESQKGQAKPIEEKLVTMFIDAGKTREEAIEMCHILQDMKSETVFNSNYNLIGMVQGAPQYGSYTKPLYDLSQAVNAGEYEHAAVLVEQIAAAIIMYAYMAHSRRMWTPMSGAGSQDSSTTAHTLMADITKEMAHKVDHRWDEEDD